MQLRIVHTTGYEYDGKALASYNQARMTPVTTPDQIVVHSRLEVSPKPWTYEYRDYFGTHVTAFEVVDPHESLTVTATSTVQTNRPPTPPPRRPGTSCASGQSRTAGPSTSRSPSWSPRRPTSAAARPRSRPGRPSRVRPPAALSALVADEVEHRPGSTDVQTPAEAAWGQRAGVCQDMVHLVLGGLRSIGIPARYVSGYFHPSRTRSSARTSPASRTPGSSGGTPAGTRTT